MMIPGRLQPFAPFVIRPFLHPLLSAFDADKAVVAFVSVGGGGECEWEVDLLSVRMLWDRPVASWVIVVATTLPGACDEDFGDLLREIAGSTCWARRRKARRAGLVLRGHGVGWLALFCSVSTPGQVQSAGRRKVSDLFSLVDSRHAVRAAAASLRWPRLWEMSAAAFGRASWGRLKAGLR